MEKALNKEAISVAFEPLQRQDVTGRVVERLQVLLERGILQAGSKLPPEQEMAKLLAISRPSLRQSNKALTLLGIIRAVPGDGTYISDSTSWILSLPFTFLMLMQKSDFVSINCPLVAETRGVIGERELSWMKPETYLINTARGSIVDQTALYQALKEGRMAGAGLDVFAVEPIPDNEPLLELENVILTPHSLCWTDECFSGMGESAVHAVLAVLPGEIPPYVVNREVQERPGMKAKLESNRSRWNRYMGDGK